MRRLCGVYAPMAPYAGVYAGVYADFSFPCQSPSFHIQPKGSLPGDSQRRPQSPSSIHKTTGPDYNNSRLRLRAARTSLHSVRRRPRSRACICRTCKRPPLVRCALRDLPPRKEWARSLLNARCLCSEGMEEKRDREPCKESNWQWRIGVQSGRPCYLQPARILVHVRLRVSLLTTMNASQRGCRKAGADLLYVTMYTNLKKRPPFVMPPPHPPQPNIVALGTPIRS